MHFCHDSFIYRTNINTLSNFSTFPLNFTQKRLKFMTQTLQKSKRSLKNTSKILTRSPHFTGLAWHFPRSRQIFTGSLSIHVSFMSIIEQVNMLSFFSYQSMVCTTGQRRHSTRMRRLWIRRGWNPHLDIWRNGWIRQILKWIVWVTGKG